MPQDSESGDRARKWGFDMGQKVSAHLGATLINPRISNEAIWNNRKILIKAAHYGVPEIGATPATLARNEAIIAALQDQDDKFTLFEVSPAWFSKGMSPSRSPRARHVMMRKCVDVRRDGKVIGRM